MNRNLWRGLTALFLVTLACRPVFAIGWNELLVFSLLFLVLLGPPIFKFIQKVEKFWRREKKDK